MSQAKTIQVSLNRHDRTPWGFRLHGGAEFGSPLMIQKVRSALGQNSLLVMGWNLIKLAAQKLHFVRDTSCYFRCLLCGRGAVLMLR